MEPFLKLVASAFAADAELKNYKFVLPNRRSVAFFNRYLSSRVLDKSGMMPEVTTISDFISEQSGLVELDRIDLLFSLFCEFNKMETDWKDRLDSFLYWGDILINDFSDIDMNLANAEDVFGNLERYKDINADYLTEEQCKVLEKYWNYRRTPGDGEHLWRPANYNSLWSKLLGLYHSFSDMLKKKGVGYSGLLYRIAYENIKDKSAEEFGFAKVVFVGFSTLSKSEEAIFTRFQQIGLGDYYWDCNSPAFRDKNNAAVKFIGEYIKNFKSKNDIGEPICDNMPKINVCAIPSGGGQAQLLQKILGEIKADKEGSKIDTAIVLPEEKYLNSVLYAIPSDYKALNITMGYPISQSSIASFVNILSTMLNRARVTDGVLSFFYDDVAALIAHPFVAGRNLNDKKLQNEMLGNHSFFVPATLLTTNLPSLKGIFDYDANLCGLQYIDSVFKILGEFCMDITDNELERHFINQYLLAYEKVKNSATENGIKDLRGQDFLFLVQRLLSSVIVPFEGEPLKGLQIMGILETRLLDFKNVIILSMNEKVFPSKSYKRSFIPPFLRTANNLPTRENQDYMFSYYFYRMISRAENVYLLYDSRVKGMSSGEESRFIKQLQKFIGDNPNKKWFFDKKEYTYESATVKQSDEIVINKTPDIMAELEAYRSGDRYLSASALANLRFCGVKFYLENVKGIREEDEITDFIDLKTFGSVVHKALELIYNNFAGKTVAAKDLEDILKTENGHSKLSDYIYKAFKTEYLGLDENAPEPVYKNDVRLMHHSVSIYLTQVLKHDIELCKQGLEYVSSENVERMKLRLGDIDVNFIYIIDRVDKVGGTLRIVDYKTGSDKNKFQSVEKSFQDNLKAIIQLFLYCIAYSQKHKYQEDIIPSIYLLKKSASEPKQSFGIYSQEPKKTAILLNGYLDYKQEFEEALSQSLHELFDKDKPFVQVEDAKKCDMCQFSKMCRRM